MINNSYALKKGEIMKSIGKFLLSCTAAILTVLMSLAYFYACIVDPLLERCQRLPNWLLATANTFRSDYRMWRDLLSGDESFDDFAE